MRKGSEKKVLNLFSVGGKQNNTYGRVQKHFFTLNQIFTVEKEGNK